jgi:hypothetical protein
MSTTLEPRVWAARLSAALWLAAFLGLAATTQASSRWATLEAIHKLENPDNLPRPGAHGELGAYQFRRTTWEMHTAVPFAAAIDRATSDAIAVAHYEWLKVNLEKAGHAATPYNIALAWNGGLRAVTAGRATRASRDYAQRAVNLAGVYDRERGSLVAAAR